MHHAAEFLGPRHTQQPVVRKQAAERLRRFEITRVVGERSEEMRGDVLMHQPAQLAPEFRGGTTHREVHARTLRQSSQG